VIKLTFSTVSRRLVGYVRADVDPDDMRRAAPMKISSRTRSGRSTRDADLRHHREGLLARA